MHHSEDREYPEGPAETTAAVSPVTASAGPVIVSGGAGFIGSHLVEALLALGHEVVAADDFSPSYDVAQKRRNLAAAVTHDRCRLVECDLAGPDLGPVLEGASVVFHLAARPGVQDSWGPAFVDTCRRNIELTQRVFEEALAAGVGRVVFASSSSVYGPHHQHQSAGVSARSTGPISPYGVTKLAGEQLADVYRARGLEVTCLRYFTVYGPRQRPDMAMHRMFEAARPGGPFFARRGDGTQSREFTHVADVVRATVAAGWATNAAGRTLDVGGGSSVTLNDVLARVADIAGAPVRIREFPAPAGDPQTTGADLGDTAAVLGWTPEIGLDDGLRDQWHWHRHRHRDQYRDRTQGRDRDRTQGRDRDRTQGRDRDRDREGATITAAS